MAFVSLTDAVPHTLGDANVVNNNNVALRGTINGGIEDANIAPVAAIAASKLSGFPADATKFLRGDGTWAVPPGVATYVFTKTVLTDVVNTAAYTDLLGGACTIPAGKMGPTAAIKIWAGGDYYNNTGANRNVGLTVTLGGAHLWWSALSDGLGQAATRRGWSMWGVIQAAGTTAQLGGGHWAFSDNNPPDVGTGGVVHYGDTKISGPWSGVATAVNMASPQTLNLLCAHTVGLAALSMRCIYARVEVTA